MNEIGCDRVREAIPDFVGGRLDLAEQGRVGAHLEACAECRAEAELVELLFASRPTAPSALAGRISASLGSRAHAGARHRHWWGLAAAAVAAVALGIGVNARRGSEAVEVPAYVAGATMDDVVLGDDGLIAGAPEFEGLSEEALMTLLEEMSVGGQA